jgi:cobalt transporter subunit CbtA
MTMFRTIVLVAGLVGLTAGLLLTALQAFTTVPLILQAETYENAGAGHSHGDVAPDHEVAVAHDHAAAWTPEDGLERIFFTGVANVLTGIGFALLIGAAGELRGGIRTWRQGVFWGLAGFAAFTLAPGLGLPPELPAMPAGELVDRQLWWIVTVALTAAGLALFAFGRTIPLGILGVVLIVAPHVVGAPQPASFDSPIPQGLVQDFVVAAVATSFVFWVVIGGLTGILRNRFAHA